MHHVCTCELGARTALNALDVYANGSEVLILFDPDLHTMLCNSQCCSTQEALDAKSGAAEHAGSWGVELKEL